MERTVPNDEQNKTKKDTRETRRGRVSCEWGPKVWRGESVGGESTRAIRMGGSRIGMENIFDDEGHHIFDQGSNDEGNSDEGDSDEGKSNDDDPEPKLVLWHHYLSVD
mmetsp:Transcript_15525/g.27714  ORF Transcript_15525/g.27714 Transcript_15525/m.27714 type:complete len:108 (+) Transcript_15525:105-428(+)